MSSIIFPRSRSNNERSSTRRDSSSSSGYSTAARSTPCAKAFRACSPASSNRHLSRRVVLARGNESARRDAPYGQRLESGSDDREARSIRRHRPRCRRTVGLEQRPPRTGHHLVEGAEDQADCASSRHILHGLSRSRANRHMLGDARCDPSRCRYPRICARLASMAAHAASRESSTVKRTTGCK